MNTRRRSTRTKTGKSKATTTTEHKTEDENTWWGVINGPMKSYLTVIGDGLDFPKNIYEDLKLTINDIELLSDETRELYLPERKDPVTINIVPSDSASADLPQLSSLRLSSYISNHTGVVTNVGFSIWALHWCPSLPAGSLQYLAVGGYKSTTDEHREIGIKQTTNMQNIIQIWRIDCRDEKDINGEERGSPYLDMVICHDYGCVYDLKWCPYGACELVDGDVEENDSDNAETHVKRLGILAGCFGDGTVRFFVIPSPDEIRRRLGKNDAETLYIKFKQEIIKLSLPGILCWTLEWGGHEKVAVGCTNGYIATWNIYDILSNQNEQQSISYSNLLCPTRYVWSHDSSVRQVLWNSHSNPTHILSCGHDGKIQIFDERDPCMKYDLRHLRTVMMSVAWSTRYAGLMFPDQEYGVRFVRTEDFAKTMRVLQHRQCIWVSDGG
ncbi:9461_t:CDS:1 [Paraglomus brasilianum]|uniref:9461_t:CDS:1 n=1 Tax=Paraglomus brasilianum TaxID=144538 RepID=A0A9N9BFA6_9GLOM|nr:9461_t:CDS:1 [Paraglomus brasilianum]